MPVARSYSSHHVASAGRRRCAGAPRRGRPAAAAGRRRGRRRRPRPPPPCTWFCSVCVMPVSSWPVAFSTRDIARQRHAEPDLRVVLDEPDRRDRQMLRVVRRAQDARQLRRHLRVVEERRLRLLDRIDDPPLPPGRRLVVVPEAIAELEPVRRHRRREHVLPDLGGRPARRPDRSSPSAARGRSRRQRGLTAPRFERAERPSAQP